MSDDEEFEDAYRAFEDELYKESTSDNSDVDSEIEESLYAQVHHSSTLTLSSSKPTKKETNPVNNEPKLSVKAEPGPSTSCVKTERDIPTFILLDSSEDDEQLLVSSAQEDDDKDDDDDDNDSDDDDVISDDEQPVTPSLQYPTVCISEDTADESKSRTDGSSDEVQVIEENWRLSINDLVDESKGKRRYYGSYAGRCHNCNERGHLSRDCPQPRKRLACFLCGGQNHDRRRCPNELCFNCNQPGHKSNLCGEPKRRWSNNCHRCYLNGHMERDCPDDWRRYHLTTEDGPVVEQTRDNKQKNVFCFNCANKGHFGHECTRTRMSRHIISNPFIIDYEPCPPGYKKRKRSQAQVEDHYRRLDRWKEQNQTASSSKKHKQSKHNKYNKHNHNSGKRQSQTETRNNHTHFSWNDSTNRSYNTPTNKNKKRKRSVSVNINHDSRIVTLDDEMPPHKKRKKNKKNKRQSMPDLRQELNDLRQTQRGFNFVHQ